LSLEGKGLILREVCIFAALMYKPPMVDTQGVTTTVKLYALSKILNGKYTALFIKLFPHFFLNSNLIIASVVN
jgi:hypothetical protein